jgi:hypothetical protein
MAFANSQVSDIIATTIQSRSGIIADNVTKNNALLRRLQGRGNSKPFSGGNVIMQELSFAQNGNAGWYSGYETLPTGAQDVISASQFDIKQAACPVTISGLELLQNSGKEQIIDLLEGRMTVGEDTMQNLVAQGVYANGTGYGGKELTGLDAMIPANPLTGTYGGIDRAAWPFWQPQIYKGTTTGGAAISATNIQVYMNRLWAKLVRGQNRPDLIVMDNLMWAFYMQSLQAIQRFSSSDSATLGFPTIKYMDADVVLDGGLGGFAPATVAYFLDTKYAFFRPHRDRNFVALDPGKRYSINQDAVTQILAFAGNMTCSNSSLQGRLDNT